MGAPPLTCWALDVDSNAGVATATLIRAKASNALTEACFVELAALFAFLEAQPDVRAVVLAAEGRNFCAGIDLSTLQDLLRRTKAAHECPGRQRLALHAAICRFQHALSSPARYPYPVVCAIQGAAFGGAIDLCTAADVRYASRDAKFCVKEVDLGITADLGTLQRLPLLIGEGRARELALTCRVFSAAEAEQYGLVSACFDDAAATLRAAKATAATLAAKSPLAVVGTKAEMELRTSHAVADGLRSVAWRNAATLLSADIEEALSAAATRRRPVFARL